MALARPLPSGVQGLVRTRLKLGRRSAGRRTPLLTKLAETKGWQSPTATAGRLAVPLAERPHTLPRGSGTAPTAEGPLPHMFDPPQSVELGQKPLQQPWMPPALVTISPSSWRLSSNERVPMPSLADRLLSPALGSSSRRSQGITESPTQVRASTMPLLTAAGRQSRPTTEGLIQAGSPHNETHSAVGSTGGHPGSYHSLPHANAASWTTRSALDYLPTGLVLPTTLPPAGPLTASPANEPKYSAPELPTPLAPTSNTAPPGGAASSGPTQGTIYLDGNALGQWLTNHLEQTMSHPNRGPSGVDPRIFPVWGPISAAY